MKQPALIHAALINVSLAISCESQLFPGTDRTSICIYLFSHLKETKVGGLCKLFFLLLHESLV